MKLKERTEDENLIKFHERREKGLKDKPYLSNKSARLAKRRKLSEGATSNQDSRSSRTNDMSVHQLKGMIQTNNQPVHNRLHADGVL